MKRLWNLSLVNKVFFSYFAVALLLVLGFYVSSNSLIRDFHIATLSDRMEQEAHLLGRVLPFDVEGADLDTICRQLAGELGSRITVIAMDGKVLGDSAESSAKMENHRGAARESSMRIQIGTGSAQRYSTTVGYDMLYRAFYQPGEKQERIVRVAMPLERGSTVSSARIRRSLIAGLMLASAGRTAVRLVVFQLFGPSACNDWCNFPGKIARGSFPARFFSEHERDEIGLLERHLNEMSQRIRDNIEHITGEKEKTESILRCMIEGVLVLDPKGKVLVINDQARGMFHVPAGTRDLHGASVFELSRHPEIQRSCRKC